MIDKIIEFGDKRDWHKHHTPENLAKSICIEAAELLECFQWGAEPDTGNPIEEMADVMIYLLTLGYEMGVDWEQAVSEKIKKNALKYPES